MSDKGPALQNDVREMLVCPIDKQSVRLEDDELVCTQCGRRYRIENGVPNMMVDEE